MCSLLARGLHSFAIKISSSSQVTNRNYKKNCSNTTARFRFFRRHQLVAVAEKEASLKSLVSRRRRQQPVRLLVKTSFPLFYRVGIVHMSSTLLIGQDPDTGATPAVPVLLAQGWTRGLVQCALCRVHHTPLPRVKTSSHGTKLSNSSVFDKPCKAA